ncbi:hypothetical protein GTA08_BOTSDO07396 [Botryosphaeria dothidea]|uniref:Uncharacterized protein n=1 Tax=Botryosphaeria dothidea TaxID=55169 RepID=A0A8H4ING5_9PEZI|nr:hypothetical protein GTA08_BOTSDO07396 [Botryosphaeria dothidea]
MSDSASLATATTKPSLKSSFKSIFSVSENPDASSISTPAAATQPKPSRKQPTWMDASLPDDKRFKAWNKERDQQFYGKGGTTGYFSGFYRKSWAWWL